MKLKPCPFCGSQTAPGVYLSQVIDDPEYQPTLFDTIYGDWQVVCDFNNGGCGVCSRPFNTPEDAEKFWNTRSSK